MFCFRLLLPISRVPSPSPLGCPPPWAVSGPGLIVLIKPPAQSLSTLNSPIDSPSEAGNPRACLRSGYVPSKRPGGGGGGASMIPVTGRVVARFPIDPGLTATYVINLGSFKLARSPRMNCQTGEGGAAPLPSPASAGWAIIIFMLISPGLHILGAGCSTTGRRIHVCPVLRRARSPGLTVPVSQCRGVPIVGNVHSSSSSMPVPCTCSEPASSSGRTASGHNKRVLLRRAPGT